MSDVNLLLCRDFQGPFWELPVNGTGLLIGWRETPESIDADVPSAVSRIIATALQHMGKTGWFSSQPVKNAQIVATTRARGGFLRRGVTAHLISSDSAETVAGCFDAAEFSWDLRAQAVFAGIDAADTSDLSVFLAAIGAHDVKLLAPILRSGIAAVLIPGVDGDVAGYYSAEESGSDRFVESLKQASKAQGVPLLETSEMQFRDNLRGR